MKKLNGLDIGWWNTDFPMWKINYFNGREYGLENWWDSNSKVNKQKYNL